jgi:hypothetical protein
VFSAGCARAENVHDARVNDTTQLNLDGRHFAMVSSTASEVDPHDPTRFAYHEADGLIWGSYDGDTVLIGRFAGTRRQDQIELGYVHVGKDSREPVTGLSSSRIEVLPDGRLRLDEHFQFEGDDTPHVSICEEVPDEA